MDYVGSTPLLVRAGGRAPPPAHRRIAYTAPQELAGRAGRVRGGYPARSTPNASLNILGRCLNIAEQNPNIGKDQLDTRGAPTANKGRLPKLTFISRRLCVLPTGGTRDVTGLE